MIDDNPEILPLTHKAWAEQGYVQCCVTSGEEAVEDLSVVREKGRRICLIALVADYLWDRLMMMLKLICRITKLPVLILTTDYCPTTQKKALAENVNNNCLRLLG